MRAGRGAKIQPGKTKGPPPILRVAEMSAVRIAKSKLPGAGQGLFAVRALPRGTQLPEPYKGKLVTKKDLLRKGVNCDYVMGLIHPKFVGVDALMHTERNPCRYVNAAKTAAQRQKINCYYFQKGTRVYYATLKNVRANEELLVDYGEAYWLGLKRNATLARLQERETQLLKKLRGAKAGERVWLEEKLEEAREALEDFYEDDRA